jgi:hydrogenase nickel incorporation protein HypB
MLRAADLVLFSKVDLLRYLDCDVVRHAADRKGVSPRTEILPVSATTGEGITALVLLARQGSRADR